MKNRFVYSVGIINLQCSHILLIFNNVHSLVNLKTPQNFNKIVYREISFKRTEVVQRTAYSVRRTTDDILTLTWLKIMSVELR